MVIDFSMPAILSGLLPGDLVFFRFPGGAFNKHYAPSFCRRCLACEKKYKLFFRDACPAL
jgi:hypothetical protein